MVEVAEENGPVRVAATARDERPQLVDVLHHGDGLVVHVAQAVALQAADTSGLDLFQRQLVSVFVLQVRQGRLSGRETWSCRLAVKAKGLFVYSAVSNPQDCSKRFTLYRLV